ncbi:MAG: LacI family DNA-binding transcriptional regulator [Collinsella sp.]|nr:LacI family DNA-binding transcriptional regulator [Collinsella sp.]
MARMRIKDIAAEAGVSPATVSRVLNNRPGTMSEATRKRVEAVIKRTGYRPSNAARSLRGGRTQTVGVVLADMRNPYSGAMLEALSDEAAARGLSLMTAISGSDARHEEEAVARLVAAGVDGLVVNSCREGTEAAASLAAAARRAPIALLDRPVAGSGLPVVTSDNDRLMHEMVEEVARGGCDRIWLLTERSQTSAIRRERARAFERELAARGLAGGVSALADARDQAARQLTDAAEEGGGPVGFIAVNGLVLLRAIEALGMTALAVPRDARLATFDEYAWNRVLFGGITTAVQDTRALAAAALDAVAAGGALERERTVVPGQVITRASTGASAA